MLSEIKKLCKWLIDWIKINEKDLFLAMVIVLAAVISFGLGRLSKIREEKTPITIEQSLPTTYDVVGKNNISTSDVDIINTGASAVLNADKIYLASKNGKKYYYAWCDSAKVIKEQNRVWFATAEEARKAGYEPAANCKGLK